MAIRMKTVVTQRARGTGVSHARTDVTVGNHTVQIDEPVVRGGTDTGPSPTEMSLAALIACTNVIGGKCAEKLGVEIGHLTIDASCEFDRRGVTLQEEVDIPFTAVTLDIVADGSASAADLARVAAETEKFCPVAKLYRGAGTKLEVTWRKA